MGRLILFSGFDAQRNDISGNLTCELLGLSWVRRCGYPSEKTNLSMMLGD